jgi:hypothetical protein
MISKRSGAALLAMAIGVLLLAPGCGGGSKGASKFDNDPSLARTYVRADITGILRQTIKLLQSGGDPSRAEQQTQALVDDMKDADGLLTTDQRRAAIDEAHKYVAGLCDRCETILDNARP